METENSEVHKMIHEGAEVYLNGVPLENEGVGFRITIPESSPPPQGDWIIKRYTPDGNIKEETFSRQEEARRAMQLFRDFGLEGHFELVCRPRVEDVVVTSYRNEPEEEPLDHLDKPDDDDDFDREKAYRDSEGDIWNYLCDQGKKGSGWYFREREGGTQYGPFSVPLVGPHEEVKDEGELIGDPQELRQSEQDTETEFDTAYTYSDRHGDAWEFLAGGWVHGNTPFIRLDNRKYSATCPTPPAKYGPYTRIEE